MGFENKNVIITGGAKGIGRCTVLEFLKQGANVVFIDIDQKEAEAYLEKLKHFSYNVKFIKFDMSEIEKIDTLIKQISKIFDKVDILVNNAGVMTAGEKDYIKDLQKVLNINLLTPLALSKLLSFNEGGSIINISSIRALQSEKDTEKYTASKGALTALTHSLAVSYKHKLRVNCVLPGWIETTGYQGSKSKKITLTDADKAQHLVNRVGAPIDVANAILFLADNDRSSFITGANLVVDGGKIVTMQYE